MNERVNERHYERPLLDDWQGELGVTIKPLPTASLTRTLSLVARERELGNIPSSLAVEIREALAAQLQRRLDGHLPKSGPGLQFGE